MIQQVEDLKPFFVNDEKVDDDIIEGKFYFIINDDFLTKYKDKIYLTNQIYTDIKEDKKIIDNKIITGKTSFFHMKEVKNKKNDISYYLSLYGKTVYTVFKKVNIDVFDNEKNKRMYMRVELDDIFINFIENVITSVKTINISITIVSPVNFDDDKGKSYLFLNCFDGKINNLTFSDEGKYNEENIKNKRVFGSLGVSFSLNPGTKIADRHKWYVNLNTYCLNVKTIIGNIEKNTAYNPEVKKFFV
jgi:hypothetical protein